MAFFVFLSIKVPFTLEKNINLEQGFDLPHITQQYLEESWFLTHLVTIMCFFCSLWQSLSASLGLAEAATNSPPTSWFLLYVSSIYIHIMIWLNLMITFFSKNYVYFPISVFFFFNVICIFLNCPLFQFCSLNPEAFFQGSPHINSSFSSFITPPTEYDLFLL